MIRTRKKIIKRLKTKQIESMEIPGMLYDINYIRNSERGWNYKLAVNSGMFLSPTPPDSNNGILKFTCSNEK